MSSVGAVCSQARELNAACGLAGSLEDGSFPLSDEILAYLVSVMKQEACIPPESSADEWDNLLKFMHVNWIMPAFYYHIMKFPFECRPPAEVMNTLQNIWLLANSNTMVASRQLGKLFCAFEAEKIPVLLLKGHALAHTIYPEPAMRQGSDIDVLVPYGEIERCEKIMSGIGYDFDIQTAKLCRHIYHHQNFHPNWSSSKAYVVEMHWKLDCGFGLHREDFTDEIFPRAIEVDTDNFKFSAPNPVDHLIYQAFHMAFQHAHNSRLSWVYDIAMLAQQVKTPVEWETLIRLSVERNCRIALEQALKMAIFWTGLEMPPEVEDFKKWPEPTQTEKNVWDLAQLRKKTITASVQISLGAIPGIKGKLSYIFRFVFPHPVMMQKYRKSRGLMGLPAAYVRRWWCVFNYL